MRAVRAARAARLAVVEVPFLLAAGFFVLWVAVAGVAAPVEGVVACDWAAMGATTISTASAAERQRAEPELELFEVGTFMYSL